MYIYIYISPQDLRGGTFPNFGPGGDVCQQMAKYMFANFGRGGDVCQQIAKNRISINKL